MSSWFRLFRVRSPLLAESLLFSLPLGTEMVHFPRLALPALYIQAGVCRVCLHGFPHSEICGSKGACPSPQLIAACHVLHRLEVPRHPPCALSSLTIKFTHEQQNQNSEVRIQKSVKNQHPKPNTQNPACLPRETFSHLLSSLLRLHSKYLPCVCFFTI